MTTIRPARLEEFDVAIWPIFHAVVRRGDTYTYPPDTPREQARALWMAPAHHCYVAAQDGRIAGSYFLRANQPGPGDHVANAAFMVHPEAQGLGIGRAMGEHALDEARRLGFRAMQFNFVVATNRGAIALWMRLGFRIVGTLPAAFRHPEHGDVDAHVMFRSLVEEPT